MIETITIITCDRCGTQTKLQYHRTNKEIEDELKLRGWQYRYGQVCPTCRSGSIVWRNTIDKDLA